MKDNNNKKKATTSFADQHRRRPCSHSSITCTSTKIHSFKSFWNSFFSSFFYTQKNYKNLQKAPLNRPVATGKRGLNPTPVTSTKQLSRISPLSMRDTWLCI